MNDKEEQPEFNRRDFLRNTSQAALMAMLGGVELRAADSAGASLADAPMTKKPPPPPVNFGVIGAGVWGREIVNTLSVLETSPVVAVCDHYEPILKRMKDDAPKAELFTDYKALLAKKEVQAVVVATPTHQHLEIVLAALDAGKHVYCEAPLANSVEDCKTIARAAQKAYRQVFQAGLQERSHPQRHFLRPFVRSGALGRNVMARSQWRQKTSWARTHANDDRAKELNWRLRNATSTGLMGENCVHLLDAVCWFLGGWPNSVTGHSSLIQWNDGRDVPDTVQCILEFPDGPNAGLRFFCDATLCSSFESIYEVYYGTDSSVLVRDSKAWMFKEPDAPFLGWEGYARKDSFGAEVGVALVADASKQSALAKKDAAPPPFSDTPLHYALEAFTWNAGNLSKALGDYVDSYGDADSPELRANLDEARKSTQKQHPAAGWREGLEATVIAIKANEAAFGRQKLALPPSLFET